MSSPAAGPIGRVISFAGIDEPVRATAANVTSGELRAHHVGLSEAMVTTVPVRVAPMLVLRLAADLGGHDVSTVDVMQATTSVVAWPRWPARGAVASVKRWPPVGSLRPAR
jgi:hypothetical protein